MSRLGKANGQRIVTVCFFCKLEKETSSSTRKFCSRKCYELNKRKFSVCAHCGISYRNTKDTKCCSRSCAQKLRPRKRGYKLTEEHKRKVSEAQKGAKGNNWKGGLWKSQPQSERKTSRYRNLRNSIFERDGWCCIECGSKEKLEVDHIKSYSKYPELRFEPTNLRTLCKPCHRKTPTYARG